MAGENLLLRRAERETFPTGTENLGLRPSQVELLHLTEVDDSETKSKTVRQVMGKSQDKRFTVFRALFTFGAEVAKAHFM